MVCLGLLTAVSITPAITLHPDAAHAKADLDSCFDFEAHRGGRDARPENTLYSYAYAMEMGATSIECDMQLTKDNVIVMSHNPILNPEITKDVNGNYVEAGKYDIRLMTVEELKKFTIGEMATARTARSLCKFLMTL